eukprot:3921815-Pleurochrysis_carterae.AAC.1
MNSASRRREHKSTKVASGAISRKSPLYLSSSACITPAAMAAVRKTTLVISDTRGHERVDAVENIPPLWTPYPYV